jgi:DNA-binding response OmpR family regulator/GGDEF domain-containing protein
VNEPSPARPSSELHVVAIVSEAKTATLMARTLAQSGDQLRVSQDLAEGLALAASEAPDVVFIDMGLGQGAGLAVVHHVRALSPGVTIYALASERSLPLGAQAVALGGTGVLMLPLSGDELLTSLAEVRGRRAERQLRKKLQAEADMSRRAAALAADLAVISEATSRRQAAERLLPILAEAAGASAGLLYLPAGEGARQLLRATTLGRLPDSPTFCEEIELLDYANEHQLQVLRLALRREQGGLALLKTALTWRTGEPPPLLDLLTAQATTMLALIGEREQSQRSAMKDPGSSAYTFAYFVDVAGREIDKARRYGRRFALATISLTESTPQAEGGAQSQAVEVVERVLAVVRDTDVLARVDENEFYLLMPETGGLGAQICRRRVVRELAGLRGLRTGGRVRHSLMVGVATFPHDGGDLSQLLRVAKHRAEASQKSLVWRAGLDRLALSEMFDALEWSDTGSEADTAPDSARQITLPSVDLVTLALCVVAEAVRGGNTLVIASQRAGMSIGGAVRSVLERDREDVRFEVVDISLVPECADLEVLLVTAQHGVYVLLGRHEGDRVRAFHANDPLLADLLSQRLADATGIGGFD